jgi:hypothetical protein
MPALTGTPKQTAWAEQIRAGLDTAIADHITHLTRRGTPEQANAVRATLAPILRNVALRHTDANWWIDNRGGTGPAGMSMPDLGGAAQHAMTAEDEAAYQEGLSRLLPRG